MEKVEAQISQVPTIKVCIGNADHFSVETKEILNHFWNERMGKEQPPLSTITSRDITEVRQNAIPTTFDSADKLSFKYKDCSGIFVRGVDKRTGKPVSTVLHISPTILLAEESQETPEFREKLRAYKAGEIEPIPGMTPFPEMQQKILELSKQKLAEVDVLLSAIGDAVVPSSLDVVVFGSNLFSGGFNTNFFATYKEKYLQIIYKWSSIINRNLGKNSEEITVIGPQNTEKEVYFENDTGNAYMLVYGMSDEKSLPVRVFQADEVAQQADELYEIAQKL